MCRILPSDSKFHKKQKKFPNKELKSILLSYFRILEVDQWARQPIKFDVITCLNLLDRCDRPYDILYDVKEVLASNGIVVLAVVLPFKSYVEVGEAIHE